MELKVVGKASLKRGFGLFRSKRVYEGVSKAKGIEKVGGVVSCSEQDGVVRMKIVVKKSDLKQLIEVMSGGGGGGGNYPSSLPSLTAEQRLNALRKKHISRANSVKGKRHNECWSPALQSIPEER